MSRHYLIAKSAGVPATTEPAFVEVCCSNKSAEMAAHAVNPIEEAVQSSSISITHNGFTITLDGVVDEVNLSRVLKAVLNAG